MRNLYAAGPSLLRDREREIEDEDQTFAKKMRMKRVCFDCKETITGELYAHEEWTGMWSCEGCAIDRTRQRLERRSK